MSNHSVSNSSMSMFSYRCLLLFTKCSIYYRDSFQKYYFGPYVPPIQTPKGSSSEYLTREFRCPVPVRSYLVRSVSFIVHVSGTPVSSKSLTIFYRSHRPQVPPPRKVTPVRHHSYDQKLGFVTSGVTVVLRLWIDP